MQEKGPPQRPHGVLNTLCCVCAETINIWKQNLWIFLIFFPPVFLSSFQFFAYCSSSAAKSSIAFFISMVIVCGFGASISRTILSVMRPSFPISWRSH